MSEASAARADRLLDGAVLGLVLVGLVAVYDASFPRLGTEQMLKQLMWAGVGLLAYWVGRLLSPVFLYRWAWVFGIGSLGLMLAVLSPLGEERGGATRWLQLGQIGSHEILVQPAELGKVALVLLLARLLSHRNLIAACKPIQERRWPGWAIIVMLASAGIVVVAQEDLGTALLFVGIGLAMLYTAGLPLRRALLLTALLAVVGAFFVVQKTYRLQRVVAFTQPFEHMYGSGYQLAHSLMGIGTGGVWGTGLGLGRAKEFLPAAETDFVFATIAEETGILGGTLVIVLLAFVWWRVFLIASRTQAMFTLLLAQGIAVMIALQSLLNLYVVTGSVPTTGVPLPFISYGGSSLVSLLFSIGLVQKVASNPMVERIREVPHARVVGRRGYGRTSVSRREYRRGVA
ncbi:MAG: FtsW/RodA/SpoVE family cell cycle protein [Armatimonadota bacterium]|nr:FtsW/RodA/SpoVE family cell cycle protein [bacterium]MCS7308871.1 FtsW/RodA/SpoVE family cell cycle protein [Armatimonadota bacterium]MDW8103401.1 FtsW/RodA/SpoVE family cell cycle protein [Armatimonadota bacterium]MDW8289747.1 FtsW/RodA/SpoVE family cell cycle protein [Armatimonadota bacterium]